MRVVARVEATGDAPLEPVPTPAALVEVAPSGIPPPLPLPPAAIAGDLTAGPRLFTGTLQRDRTALFALGIIVTFVFVHVASRLIGIDLLPAPSAEQMDARGQVDDPKTVTVELVEAPDANSSSRHSQAGEKAPPAPPTPETPPTPEAQETLQKDAEKPKPEKPDKPVKTAKAEEPALEQLRPEDFDVTMDSYAKAVEKAQEERKRQKAAPRPSEAAELAGAAPKGQQSPYAKSVIAALSKTKPKVYVTRGEVFVQFTLTMAGQIASVEVLRSSHDPLIDQMAINAIKTAKYPVPTPGVDPRDLHYMIHYVFE